MENRISETIMKDRLDIRIEKKNEEEFFTEDYVIKNTNGEIIYEANFVECRGFLRGYYYGLHT